MDIPRVLYQSLATGEVELALTMLSSVLLPPAAPGLSIKLNLQMIGDVLTIALRQKPVASRELAPILLGKLTERSWRGDYELTQQLNAALGVTPIQMLRPLAVDLEELSNILEGDPISSGGVVNLETGEVWPSFVADYAIESGEYEADEFEDDCWMRVDCMGSHDSFDDMVEFIATIEGEPLTRRLEQAVSGRHPFRSFKDALWDQPESVLWRDFSNDRQRGRARKWLAGCGYFPSVRVRNPSGI